MTPGARIQAAIALCEKIEAASVPADGVIAGYFRKRRYAGAKDRRAVIDQVYNLLRRRARLDWRIREAGHGPSPRARIIAYLALCEETPACGVEAAFFTGERHCPAPLNAEEQALARLEPPLQRGAMPSWTAFEYPEWLDGRLRQVFGDALDGEMAALNEPAPLDVRVNALKGSRQEAAKALADEGVDAAPTKLSPQGLRISGRVRLDATAAFRGGLIEVQDEGSQLIALLTGAEPGMAVLDLCAGAGGKTLALAAAMKASGELVASDVSERRMAAMKKRLMRAGAGQIERHAFSGEDDSQNDPWIEKNREKFDRVLADAPCAGSGVWRRDVTAKWRLTMGEMRNVIASQRQILSKASRLVNAGGRLVYATCSVLMAENEDQIQWFQETHPGFKIIPISQVWKETIGGSCPCKGPFLRLSPASTATDGFFAAVLEKTG